MTTPPPIPLAQQIELMERSVRLVTDERVAAGFADVLASLQKLARMESLDELTAEAQRLGLYDTKLGTETGEKGE